ncbi:MAG: DNA translocase FtsK [Chloroflexi bacterium]|nr:DNA translocase FtsK [Chloroflexota bacterium]
MLDARTPGILGHRFAGWLTSLLGGPPSVLLVVAGAGLCAIAAADLRANQIWHALRASGQLTWELTTTAAGYVADVFGIVAEWVRDRRAVASVRKLANSLPDPVPSQPLTEGLTEAPAEAAVETRKALPSGAWEAPSLEILAPRRPTEPVDPHLRDQARVIEETLASFGIEARVLEINQGPAVTQFGVEPAPGVPVSRILARMNDLALRLGAAPIRMEAPVPGRRMLGIEVPNLRVSVVGLREVLESEGFARSKAQIPLALGRDIAGKPVVADLARMPHLLIAGATGSGKSVCINALVACLLSQFTPDQLQFVMVDPKMVELIGYNGIPHLRMPVVTDMDRIVGTLKWVAQEMERRYKLFAAHTQRNIDGFNQLARKNGERALPYLVVIIDELADLMMTAPEEAEKTICRLAQLARATGIHLVVATQRPSVDVVTGLIKANFPSRIAFAVTSQIDSRVILDMGGAERLLGRGDMLYLPPDASKLIRVQGTYVAEEEIEALVTYWKDLGSPQYNGQDLEDVETLGKPADPTGDELYERAVELAQQTRRISVSLLQRRLGIGYPRAARLVDQLEEHGIISAAEDGRAREVLVQGELTPPE